MIKITAWKDVDRSPQVIEPERFDPSLIGESQLVWIDFQGDDEASHRQFMQQQIGLPRLAVDDALRKRHPPKYEDLENGWCFLLMRGFDVGSTSVKFGTLQLSLFWRDNLVVTRHETPTASIDEVEHALRDGELAPPRDSWKLLYALIRKVIDRYLPILLRIEARLDEIEEMLLKQPGDRLLSELMEFSSQLKRLRRICGYHEKSLASLQAHAKVRHGVNSAQLTDLFEQAERQHSLANLYYEITTDLINGYLSVSSHRLNNVMRVLTVVTVLFVPLTFIAGVYGMNFQHMPELGWKWGYFVVLGVMATVAITLLLLFRRRGWL